MPHHPSVSMFVCISLVKISRYILIYILKPGYSPSLAPLGFRLSTCVREVKPGRWTTLEDRKRPLPALSEHVILPVVSAQATCTLCFCHSLHNHHSPIHCCCKHCSTAHSSGRGNLVLSEYRTQIFHQQ